MNGSTLWMNPSTSRSRATYVTLGGDDKDSSRLKACTCGIHTYLTQVMWDITQNAINYPTTRTIAVGQ